MDTIKNATTATTTTTTTAAPPLPPLRIMNLATAAELSMVAASVGLASNLAALRALATEGIQRGHMSLHARSVALGAGAIGSEVEALARELVEHGEIKTERAVALLEQMRAAKTDRTDS